MAQTHQSNDQQNAHLSYFIKQTGKVPAAFYTDPSPTLHYTVPTQNTYLTFSQQQATTGDQE